MATLLQKQWLHVLKAEKHIHQFFFVYILMHVCYQVKVILNSDESLRAIFDAMKDGKHLAQNYYMYKEISLGKNCEKSNGTIYI